MRKLLNMFLVVTLAFLSFIFITPRINAYEPVEVLHGEDVVVRLEDSKTIFQDLINKLTNWSNTYAVDLKDLLDKNLIGDSSDIDLIISKLALEGHNDASTKLEDIKDIINSDMDYLKETFDIVEYYLMNPIEDDEVDEIDIYRKVRSLFEDLKLEINGLMKIYYNLYYDEFEEKIDSCSTYDELMLLIDEFFDVASGSKFSVFKNRLNRIKNIYIAKELSIYDELIKSEFKNYFNTIEDDFDELYDVLEVKLQTELDNKINSIIGDVDITNVDQVISANKKIYSTMDKINETKVKIDTKFSTIDKSIKVFSNYFNTYKNKIITRLEEAYNYTKSKLIDLKLILGVKKNSDKKYIKIDSDNGILVYDSKDLKTDSLINKLAINIGTLQVVNTYSGKVGTKSKIQVYYDSDILSEFVIVIKGDISPSGRIDITDLVSLCDKMYKSSNLGEYEMLAADFDGNNKIDITDLVSLCDKIYK